MKLAHLQVNHIPVPMGYQMTNPVFSYRTEDAVGKKQQSGRILVAADAAFENILADTGETCIDSLGQEIVMDLRPRTRYFWKVSTVSDAGETAQAASWFETGKMEEAWCGRWITAKKQKGRNPVFHKHFSAEDIASARLYICGLGLFEAEINGKRVGEEYLTPYCTVYSSWVQALTFDVTDLLAGENEISVELADGWYKGRFGFDGKLDDPGFYGDSWALIAELHITDRNGRETVVATDDSWTVTRSNILFSNIYDGERRDDTLEAKEEGNAVYLDEKRSLGLHLKDRLSTPVKIQEVLEPVELLETPVGEKVFDLGQNMAGSFCLKVHEPEGTKIRVQVGEVLQKGCFYRDNLRTALAEYIYISDGGEHVLMPKFTFYGYRYAKVEGIADLKQGDFKGLVFYSDMEMTGTMETGAPLVNQLVSNIRWGLKSNFIDVPTDCPQRDERMGWTADTQVFVPTANYLAAPYAFYNKFMYDVRAEQQARGGMIPVVVPSFGNQMTCSVWGDAGTIIPWNTYLYSGDWHILRESVDGMAAWVDYITREDGDDHAWRRHFHFGDWLALDHPAMTADSVKGGTEDGYIADIYYMYSAELTAKAAGVLLEKDPEAAEGTGRAKELKALRDKYTALAERIREDIRYEFFTGSGRCVADTQTGYMLALMHHLTDDEDRTFADLLQVLNYADNKLKTGFVGTPKIALVLSDRGRDDLAYDILQNEEYPGWLYEVNLGATTIWERWNSMDPDGSVSSTGMNSFNHYASGSIGEWMWQTIGGIAPTEDGPGFKKVILRPVPDYRMKFAKSVYPSPAGTYTVSWEVHGINEVSIHVEIPFDCEAVLELPFRTDKERFCTLTAGSYDYRYRTAAPIKKIFSVDMTFFELLDAPKVKKFLNSRFPQLASLPYFMRRMTPREAIKERMGDAAEALLAALDESLRKL